VKHTDARRTVDMGAKAKELPKAWQRIIEDPRRWTGGSAMAGPFGPIAVDEEHSATEPGLAPQRRRGSWNTSPR
jgi:hypothetical protein